MGLLFDLDAETTIALYVSLFMLSGFVVAMYWKMRKAKLARRALQK